MADEIAKATDLDSEWGGHSVSRKDFLFKISQAAKDSYQIAKIACTQIFKEESSDELVPLMAAAIFVRLSSILDDASSEYRQMVKEKCRAEALVAYDMAESACVLAYKRFPDHGLIAPMAAAIFTQLISKT